MNKRNTRDFGLMGTGAGKGDAPRYTHNENWIRNFEAIDWGHGPETPLVPVVSAEQYCPSQSNSIK